MLKKMNFTLSFAYLLGAYFLCLCLRQIQQLISFRLQFRDVVFNLCCFRKVLTANALIQTLLQLVQLHSNVCNL